MNTLKSTTALLLAIAFHASAAPNELTPAETSAGWKLLFDGKTTSAWRSHDKETFPSRGWSVEDGALHCVPSSGRPNAGGGDIVTRENFTDFELAWEWKIQPGGNSGVKYLIKPRPANSGSMFLGDDGKALVGFEYQLIDDAAHPDAKKGPIRTSGALYQLIEPAPKKNVRPAGEWNSSRILVRDNHIEHWLNDEKTVEAEIGGAKLNAAIAASKYNKIAGFGSKVATPILLQDHGDGVWFRSIKIRQLPAADPAGSAKPRFEKEIAAFEAADRVNSPQPGGIVFTGASGIRLWTDLGADFAGLPVINRAFGGSYTSELTDYADRILIPLKPKMIVLQPGSNDLVVGRSPEQHAADFKTFVAKIRAALPAVRIVYLGINPSPKRWNIREAQIRTNSLVREYTASGENLAFVDLWTSSLGPDGQPKPGYYIADQLHPSRKAYQERAPLILPYLK